MKRRLVLIVIIGFAALVQARDNSVEVTLEDTPEHFEGPQNIFDARAQGRAEAEKDIRRGRFHVKDCGKPSTPHETDTVTGYPIEYIGPCGSWTLRTMLRDEEVRAYNRTMREWYAKHKKHR